MRPLTQILSIALLCLVGTAVNALASTDAPLTITDATFTDSVAAREPGDRLTSFTLGEEESSRLWFWFRVECGDACIREPEVTPDIPIYVKWAHREGDTFVVRDTIPLTVRGVQWRAWTYKEHLTPGTWRVAVFTEEGPVCLHDKCEFTVQVGEQSGRSGESDEAPTEQTEPVGSTPDPDQTGALSRP